ncbi:uracil-DNA glycosylase [Limihaloglobus sulfuriphilus]|nr:uracil-DNA glycosylase [Limihaloglobus sulfuriphilus]
MADIDLKEIAKQHLEIDSFFTGDFGILGPELDFRSLRAEITPQPETKTSDPAAISEFLDDVSAAASLEQIASMVNQCRKCELGSSRLNPVPGEGSPNARLVFVGEAPGQDEDKTGRPFVGRAGKMLTNIITAMGLSRNDVFICNTIKCRPPENRDPLIGEKNACRPFLDRQLELISPDVIVALGSHAARELLGTDEGIGKLRGRFHDYTPSPGAKTIKVMPTYHPSYLLRAYTVDNRRRVWDDMLKVVKELGLELPKKER